MNGRNKVYSWWWHSSPFPAKVTSSMYDESAVDNGGKIERTWIFLPDDPSYIIYTYQSSSSFIIIKGSIYFHFGSVLNHFLTAMGVS